MSTDLVTSQANGLPVLEPVLVVSAEDVDRIVAESRQQLGTLAARLTAALEEARVAESAIAANDPSDELAEALIQDGIRARIADHRAELARALETARQEAERRLADAEVEAAAILHADSEWIRELLDRTSPGAVPMAPPAPTHEQARIRLDVAPSRDDAWEGQLIEPPSSGVARLRSVVVDALLPLGGVVTIIVLLLLLLG